MPPSTKLGPGFKFLGKAGIDSGSLMICDPSYVVSDGKHKTPLEDAFPKGLEQFCEKQQSRTQIKGRHGGPLGVCVSGFGGDGEASVYLQTDSDGRPLQLLVVF